MVNIQSESIKFKHQEKIMFTKLPRILSRASVRPYATNKANSNSSNTIMDNPKWLENQTKAAVLEGIQQSLLQQELDTYNKVKKQIESQTSVQSQEKKTVTVKEAANILVDKGFSHLRQYFGDKFTNSIEHPLRSFAFPKFERMFTYLAKDGRVDKEIVDNFSKYALYLLVVVASLYVYEKIKSYKDEIAKLEKEIQELEKQYTAKNFTHSDIRDEIIKTQNHLLAKKDELKKYTGIREALEEAKEEIAKEAGEQNFIKQIKDQFFSMFNAEGYEKEKVKSFLNKQNKDPSVVKEVDKWTSTNVAIDETQGRIAKIGKKCDDIQNALEKLEQKLDIVGEQVVHIGEKLEGKQSQLNNKLGYSFFKQIKQETEETPTAKSRFEI